MTMEHILSAHHYHQLQEELPHLID